MREAILANTVKLELESTEELAARKGYRPECADALLVEVVVLPQVDTQVDELNSSPQ